MVNGDGVSDADRVEASSRAVQRAVDVLAPVGRDDVVSDAETAPS